MPFIPHSPDEERSMLDTIGVADIEALFDEIPDTLRIRSLDGVPESLSEAAIARHMHGRAADNTALTCFIGSGAYDHHIPAAVWELATRGEFYTAYTPYQAEASQGTLQLLYEFQTMMTALTGMYASNASLYDGASGLAEAVLMAVRGNRKSKNKRILMPSNIHPAYRQVVETITRHQGIVIETIDFDVDTGRIESLPESLLESPGDFAALVIPMPNYLGVLEDVDRLTDWAHEHNALVIAQVNPMALALFKAPGQWGEQGADIVCGEGQPLGIPLSAGGPYFGFLCATKALIRQMPGRIIGRTVDLDGKPGFTLTLQAREQHIRRSKATSNICTNQGLMVTAATIYLSIMGAKGLKRVATVSHANTKLLVERLTSITGVSRAFDSAFFHECVLQFDGVRVAEVHARLIDAGILGGKVLTDDYPALGEALMVCATELRTADDIESYAAVLADIMRTL